MTTFYHLIREIDAEIRSAETHHRYLLKRKHELIQHAINPPVFSAFSAGEWKAINNPLIDAMNNPLYDMAVRRSQPAPQPAPAPNPFDEAMKIVAAERRTGGTRE